MILAILLAEGRRMKRKLFELVCWSYEPMVPQRMMEDRLDRLSSIAERTAQRERTELEERIKHLQREVARLSEPPRQEPPGLPPPSPCRKWWPRGFTG